MYIPCWSYSINSETLLITKNLFLTQRLNFLWITVMFHTEATVGAIWIQRGLFSVFVEMLITLLRISLNQTSLSVITSSRKVVASFRGQLTGVTYMPTQALNQFYPIKTASQYSCHYFSAYWCKLLLPLKKREIIF